MRHTRFDVLYRGPGVTRLDYQHNGASWGYYAFERRGHAEALHKVSQLQAQGYEAIAVGVGVARPRDIDD